LKTTLISLIRVTIVLNEVFIVKNVLGVEIPVLDLDKAINFYEIVFGWKFDWERFPGQGYYELNECVMISIFQTQKIRPKGLNVVIGIEDLDGVLERIVQEDGKIVKSKTSAGEMGSFAVFQDCFGNELSLFSETK
jgi:predicted enzyme related to lactoylglutathione lyase